MIERITCGKVNCYIVGQPGRCALVDTATEKYFDRVCSRAKELGVRLIVLTHCHYDHAGGAAKLSAALGVPVAVHPADLPLLADPACMDMYADTFTGRLLLRFSRKSLRRRVTAFAPGAELCEGLDLAAFGAEGTIMALPGHTPGSVGVYYENSLVAGDAAFNILSPCRAKIYADGEDAESSYRRILADPRITTVYVGHGRPIFLSKKDPPLTFVTE